MKAVNTYQFGYDALGHRISETDNGTLTKQWVWDGGRMVEERNASNVVTKRFYAQGEQISGSNYYYTRDHLGSVREMTNSSGAIVARYDYDPYGRVTPIGTITVPSDFQYAGYYEHASSGLNLTKYRAYDPNTARWLSRDPLGEGHDATLYSYAYNDPASLRDPLGLTTLAFGFQGGFNFGIMTGGSLQLSLSWDPNAFGNINAWQIGVVASGTPPGVGASSGIGGSAGLIGTYSSATCPSQLRGWSGSFGGSGGVGIVGGANVGNLGGNSPATYSLDLGLGLEDSPELAAAPVEGHSTASYTATASTDFASIYEFFDSFNY